MLPVPALFRFKLGSTLRKLRPHLGLQGTGLQIRSTQLSASLLKIPGSSRTASVPLHSQGGAASYCQHSPDPVDVARLQPGATHGSRVCLLTFPRGMEKDVDGSGRLAEPPAQPEPMRMKMKKKPQASSDARLGPVLMGT